MTSIRPGVYATYYQKQQDKWQGKMREKSGIEKKTFLERKDRIE